MLVFETLLDEFLERQKPDFDKPSHLQKKIPPRTVLYLDEKAKKLWEDFYNDTGAKQKPGILYSEISDFASKSGDNVARIAAQNQVLIDKESGIDWSKEDFGNRKEEIHEEAVRLAIEEMYWYLEQILRFLGKLSSPQAMDDGDCIVSWMRRKGHRVITKRELQKLVTPSYLREGKRFQAAIDDLMEQEDVDITTKGRTTYIQPLN